MLRLPLNFYRTTVIKNTSFRIQYELINDKGNIIAEALDIIVFYDFDKNIKLIIPDELKNKIIETGK